MLVFRRIQLTDSFRTKNTVRCQWRCASCEDRAPIGSHGSSWSIASFAAILIVDEGAVVRKMAKERQVGLVDRTVTIVRTVFLGDRVLVRLVDGPTYLVDVVLSL